MSVELPHREGIFPRIYFLTSRIFNGKGDSQSFLGGKNWLSVKGDIKVNLQQKYEEVMKRRLILLNDA
jgi:hypothetical protein